ncbi:MAG: type II toxin-antitoxin system MqsA family antitoxin [Desulfococcaceae bacterium]
MYKYGDCSFCGGEVLPRNVELDYRYKGKLYVFQNVPAGVCCQCGEKYLTAHTAKKIEHAVHTERNWNQIKVPMKNFQITETAA